MEVKAPRALQPPPSSESTRRKNKFVNSEISSGNVLRRKPLPKRHLGKSVFRHQTTIGHILAESLSFYLSFYIVLRDSSCLFDWPLPFHSPLRYFLWSSIKIKRCVCVVSSDIISMVGRIVYSRREMKKKKVISTSLKLRTRRFF